MAQHKRHHYVPKCYLRPFSLSSSGKAINLYNIPTQRAIMNAPVKGQCARDYFYGEADDLRLEKALQIIEGAYARSIRKMEAQANSLDGDDLEVLREFALLQWFRTDTAIQRMRTLHEDFETVANRDCPGAVPQDGIDDRNLISVAIRNYIELRTYITRS
jgi:hypothetical protein